MTRQQKTCTLEELARLASCARSAIESADRSRWGGYASFPSGACGNVSEVLARVMRERLGLDALYVSGTDSVDRQSHAWVEVNDVIIDITADQFGQPPVIVRARNPWHSIWKKQQRRGPCPPVGWHTYPILLWNAVDAAVADRLAEDAPLQNS